MQPTQPQTDKRYLARHVIKDDRDYGLSLVETDGRTISISPFVQETHSTVFVDTIRITTDNEGLSKLEITR